MKWSVWRKKMDIILYNIIACLASFILGYFFGSIPVGVILCRLFYKADPRESGSKNSGGTNVGRLFGKKIGFATIFFDALKTFGPMILVWALINFAGIKELFSSNLGGSIYHDGLLAIMLVPLGSTIGHCWPIFAQFKGGKAVSSYGGFAISTCWGSFICSGIAFLTTLKISKHVSLSSIVGSTVSTVLAWTLYLLGIFLPDFNVNFVFWGFGKTALWAVSSLEFAIVSTLIGIILICRHYSNIKRLASGTESKIKWMK